MARPSCLCGWCSKCLKREQMRRYYARHPEQVAKQRERVAARGTATEQVRVAVARGALTREPCEKCGDPVSFAHHDDYSLPLAVRWLCGHHHAAEHGRTTTTEVH